MTAEPQAQATAGGTRANAGLNEFLSEWRRHFPSRVRDRRFWHVQAMVVAAAIPHYVIEVLGFTNPFETFHGLAVTLYVIPLLYAAINFGWEGALLTGLECALLTSPSMWIWHRSEYHWFAELGQLLITLPVGLLVAWRVDKEAVERRRAETTSARLALLNEVGESLGQTLDVERQLPGVLRRLLAGLSLQAVWLVLEPVSEGGAATVLAEGDQASSVDEQATRLHARAAASPGTIFASGNSVVVLLHGEEGTLGSLGARPPEGETLGEEQLHLLSTVAHEIRVAVENARLYKERQESLQSYVRQITQAQEDERLRISRELHDETAQELVHLVRRLEAAGEDADPAMATRIDELLDMTRHTLKSVRRFSRDLRPSVLDDLGLVAAIEMVVEETNSRLSKGAHVEVLGEPRRVDKTVELALFRIAQEGLRNIEKHAEATSATVKLNFADQEIQLSVKDDGNGFSPPRDLAYLARRGSLGLLGMKERADLVGGSFELRSSPGHGSELAVTVKAN